MTIAVCDILHVQDLKGTSEDGGEPTGGVWNQRDLNTVLTNTISGASLSGDEITLPAGEYLIKAGAPAFDTENNRLRLRNITDGVTELLSPNHHADATSGTAQITLMGYFVLDGTKVLQLQHWPESAGVALNFGVSITVDGERYAEVLIEKLD